MRHTASNLGPTVEHKLTRICPSAGQWGLEINFRTPHQKPNKRRPHLTVANALGDLDAYVVHHDHASRFSSPEVKRICNAISERLHALMPRASEAMVGLLKEQRVKERLYTTAARDVISDDAIVINGFVRRLLDLSWT